MAKITFSDERTTFEATVRPATFGDDIKRIKMQEEAMKADFTDVHQVAVATFTYPRLICATPSGKVTIDGESIDWPPTVDQLMNMSVGAVNLWYIEVSRCNPTWFPAIPSEDEEKKVSESSLTKD
jgi:hypothetical protein